MVLKKGDNLVVVHFTSQQIKLDHVVGAPLAVWEFLLGQLIQPDHPPDEELEQSVVAVQAQVVHALGVVEAEPGALPSRHDAHPDLAPGDGREPQLIELGFPLLDLSPIDHMLEGLELDLGGVSRVLLGAEVNFFVELIDLLEVDVPELLQELLLEGGILQGFIVLDEVPLPVLLGDFQNIGLHSKYILISKQHSSRFELALIILR